LEEKLHAGNCVNRNVEGKCNNIKKCPLDTVSEYVGKVEKRARNPWITQEIISKIDERRKWKRVNNELRRATDKTKLENLESKCDEITELQRTGRYDLM
jgi:DNA primase catalytic subunit